MIAKDMKYTALYWALRFRETAEDVHVKSYNGYRVTIYAEKHYVDFGEKIQNGRKYDLNSHKSFVVLECIDRLLTKGYSPEQIILTNSLFDIFLNVDGWIVGIDCFAWDDYSGGIELGLEDYEVSYTSRLVSGLLEYKGVYSFDGFDRDFGVGSDAYNSVVNLSSDFEMNGSELVQYKGKDAVVHIPEGVVSVGASAFWNNTSVREVILPRSLERLGGDCFYYCTNLENVTIPPNVRTMGNNPFAGCPKLTLKNESPFFCMEDGVLYDKGKTTLIYFPIKDERRSFSVPDGVICLGKHCFYACDHLHEITVPESVIRFENNPFSGCTELKLDCRSPYYIVEDGVIYNRFRTSIIGCLNGSQIDCLTIPESVTLISRNSFWNCKGIERVILTKNIDRIGYNPFAGCENLLIENGGNPNFCVENGIVFDKGRTHLLCATDRAVGAYYHVPDGVTHINRGVFSGCKSLCKIDFGDVTYIDKSSFTNCTGLTELYIPDAVTYIGEWAFSYCRNLRKISINKHTFIDKNAFNECPVTVEWRD